MGMSSPEWSRYMHDELGLPESPAEINDEVVRQMLDRYRGALPLIDGAVDAVRRLADAFTLGVASSSNRPLIEAVLEGAGITRALRGGRLLRGGRARETGAGRVPRGGSAARAEPAHCAAVEDSSNGLRAARAAGMRVIAFPNAHYPPAPDALALADVVLDVAGGADAGASPRGLAARSRCGRRGPSHSRGRRRARPRAPRSARSRGRSPDPDSGS